MSLVVRTHISISGGRGAHARPLSLPPRCALVSTKAQRAGSKPPPWLENGDFKFESSAFPPPARCAFVVTRAQRAIDPRGAVAKRSALTPRSGRRRPAAPARARAGLEQLADAREVGAGERAGEFLRRRRRLPRRQRRPQRRRLLGERLGKRRLLRGLRFRDEGARRSPARERRSPGDCTRREQSPGLDVIHVVSQRRARAGGRVDPAMQVAPARRLPPTVMQPTSSRTATLRRATGSHSPRPPRRSPGARLACRCRPRQIQAPGMRPGRPA